MDTLAHTCAQTDTNKPASKWAKRVAGKGEQINNGIATTTSGAGPERAPRSGRPREPISAIGRGLLAARRVARARVAHLNANANNHSQVLHLPKAHATVGAKHVN
jgi:hypothetical protein